MSAKQQQLALKWYSPRRGGAACLFWFWDLPTECAAEGFSVERSCSAFSVPPFEISIRVLIKAQVIQGKCFPEEGWGRAGGVALEGRLLQLNKLT